MLGLVSRRPQGNVGFPLLVRLYARNTKYSKSQKEKFAREQTRRDSFNRDSLKNLGYVPKLDSEVYEANRSLTSMKRTQSHMLKRYTLFEIYEHSTEKLLETRNLTIISKISINNLTLILTKELDQFMSINGELYDLNNRYTELNRRIYDYCFLQDYLDNYENEELALFMRLLSFKNQALFSKDSRKYTSDMSASQKNLIVLDTLVGIDDLVEKAAQKFQREHPDKVDAITELKKINEVSTNFIDLQDTKVKRREMKGIPNHFSGFYRLMLTQVLEFLEEERLQKEEKEFQTEEQT